MTQLVAFSCSCFKLDLTAIDFAFPHAQFIYLSYSLTRPPPPPPPPPTTTTTTTTTTAATAATAQTKTTPSRTSCTCLDGGGGGGGGGGEQLAGVSRRRRDGLGRWRQELKCQQSAHPLFGHTARHFLSALLSALLEVNVNEEESRYNGHLQLKASRTRRHAAQGDS